MSSRAIGLLLALFSLTGATYYMKPDGSDVAAGTSEATAWLSFTKALGSAGINGGDTLIVMDGIWDAGDEPWGVAADNDIAGTATDYTYIIADTNATPIFDANARTAPQSYGIRFYSTDAAGLIDHIYMSGLTFRDYPDFEGGTSLGTEGVIKLQLNMTGANTATGYKFLDMTFDSVLEDTTNVAFFMAVTDADSSAEVIDSLLIEDCAITGVGNTAIVLAATHNAIIRNTTLRRPYAYAVPRSGADGPNGISCTRYAASGTVIEDCVISGFDHGAELRGRNGIFRRNVIHDITDDFVWLHTDATYDATGWIIEDNVGYWGFDEGIELEGYGHKFTHNTFYGMGNWGCLLEASTSTVLGNIFVEWNPNGETPNGNAGVYRVAGALSNTFENNIFYAPGGTVTHYDSVLVALTTTQLNATSWANNNIEQAPALIDTTAQNDTRPFYDEVNLRPLATSPAVGLGWAGRTAGALPAIGIPWTTLHLSGVASDSVQFTYWTRTSEVTRYDGAIAQQADGVYLVDLDVDSTYTAVVNGEWRIYDHDDVRIAMDAVEIPPSAVWVRALEAGAIAAGDFADDAITAAAIAPDAIGDEEVAADIWTTFEMPQAAVDSIVAGLSAAAFDVDSVRVVGLVGADAIGAASIANNAIGATEINTGAIDVDAISAGAITDAAFAAGAIDALAIDENAIGASEIATNAIGALELQAGAIAADAFAAGAIDAAAIANNAIDAATFTADAITAANVAADFYTETADTVQARLDDDFAGIAPAVVAHEVRDSLAADFASIEVTLTAADIDSIIAGITEAGIDVDSVRVVAYVWQAGRVDTLTAGSVNAAAIADDAIDATAIATEAIGALEIAASAIGPAEVAVNAIGSDELAVTATTEIGTAVRTSTGYYGSQPGGSLGSYLHDIYDQDGTQHGVTQSTIATSKDQLVSQIVLQTDTLQVDIAAIPTAAENAHEVRDSLATDFASIVVTISEADIDSIVAGIVAEGIDVDSIRVVGSLGADAIGAGDITDGAIVADDFAASFWTKANTEWADNFVLQTDTLQTSILAAADGLPTAAENAHAVRDSLAADFATIDVVISEADIDSIAANVDTELNDEFAAIPGAVDTQLLDNFAAIDANLDAADLDSIAANVDATLLDDFAAIPSAVDAVLSDDFANIPGAVLGSGALDHYLVVRDAATLLPVTNATVTVRDSLGQALVVLAATGSSGIVTAHLDPLGYYGAASKPFVYGSKTLAISVADDGDSTFFNLDLITLPESVDPIKCVMYVDVANYYGTEIDSIEVSVVLEGEGATVGGIAIGYAALRDTVGTGEPGCATASPGRACFELIRSSQIEPTDLDQTYSFSFRDVATSRRLNPYRSITIGGVTVPDSTSANIVYNTGD